MWPSGGNGESNILVVVIIVIIIIIIIIITSVFELLGVEPWLSSTTTIK